MLGIEKEIKTSSSRNITDDQINDLVSKLQQLLPEIRDRRSDKVPPTYIHFNFLFFSELSGHKILPLFLCLSTHSHVPNSTFSLIYLYKLVYYDAQIWVQFATDSLSTLKNKRIGVTMLLVLILFSLWFQIVNAVVVVSIRAVAVLIAVIAV